MTRYIKFTVGSVSEGYKTIELFIGAKSVSYKILRNGLNEIKRKNSRVVEVGDKWLKKFNTAEIFSWDKEYFDDISGGDTQWELVFKCDRKFYHGRGFGDYPESLERFLNWIDEVAPEMQFVNRRRLERVTLNCSREGEIFETLIIDRREKTLTLDKKISHHLYIFESAIEEIFESAQIFFDGLEVQYAGDRNFPKINIELVRHDGSIENIDALYNEVCLPGLANFVGTLRNCIKDLSAEIFSPNLFHADVREGKLILCKVQFKSSYKHYTYRAEDETLSVGDIVDVPVGRNNEVGVAKIVDIGYFDEYEAPFPVDRIKFIIGKHIVNDFDNY